LDPYEALTPREREVLQLAAEGLTNPQIAEKLALSPRTVEMHRGNLTRKLGLRTQTELVRYAIWRGLLPQPA
jgi:DNA-binding CsgD family transcriptional regulator